MNYPLVTIILATFNRAHLIAETLRSIQNQTYNIFECLIIDDGGNDNTEEVIAPFLVDKRFNFLKRSQNYQKGLSGCRNFGLDEATGEYVIFFDDDDIVHPQNLAICVKVLNHNKNVYFSRYNKMSFEEKFDYSVIYKINEVTNKIAGEDLLEQMITGKVAFASCTVMWKSKCFDDIRFNESLHYAEEWECYARIISIYSIGVLINETLYFNRNHPESNTGEFWRGSDQRMQSKIEAAKIIISYLENLKMLTPALVKFFSWESARLESPDLFSHLITQTSLNRSLQLREKFRYYGSPLIKVILRIKKELDNYD